MYDRIAILAIVARSDINDPLTKKGKGHRGGGGGGNDNSEYLKTSTHGTLEASSIGAPTRTL